MKFMCFAKRFVPFAVALGIGLFVAGFFVTLSAPKAEVDSRSDRYSKLRMENIRLKRENCRLKKETRNAEHNVIVVESEFELKAPPPPPPAAPIAPKAPVAPKPPMAPKAPRN